MNITTLPLSCDIGGWSPVWSPPGDFLQNFILIKSSHPEQISKSAHYPRSPSNYINISSHQRFMSRVIIFPGWFLLFSTTTRVLAEDPDLCSKTIKVLLRTQTLVHFIFPYLHATRTAFVHSEITLNRV